MEKDYIPRSSSSAQRYRSAGSSPQRGDYPRRRPPQRGSSRRKGGPPPFLWIALLLIVVIVAVVLIVAFAGGNRKDPDSSSSSAQSSSLSGVSSAASGVSSPSSGTSSPSSLAESDPVSATPPPESVPSGAPQEMENFFQIGDTGFEYYNFVVDYANQYITTISNVGKDLDGVATVYDMVIPTSVDITLPESYINEHGINSSDQKKAIEYLYSSINGLSPSVKTVPIFDALKLHNNEYIYFRTDHHWTQLGAYYAYCEFCKAKGVEAVALDQFEKKEYGDFLGSFYRDDPNDAMGGNPDTVEAYLSSASTSLTYTTAEGDTLEDQPVIADGSAYDSEWKYLIFCAGDQPYEEITNSDITDGSACVVVKESFGNAFIPFLVNHYQTIYVVDYRYYQGNISSLVREKGAKDLIFLNNISMTRNEDLVNSLDNSF